MFTRKPLYIVEVRLMRLPQPKKDRRWRWDAAVFELTEGKFPGVFDCRLHMGGNFGYTRTRWGALREIAKSFEEFEEHYVLA